MHLGLYLLYISILASIFWGNTLQVIGECYLKWSHYWCKKAVLYLKKISHDNFSMKYLFNHITAKHFHTESTSCLLFTSLSLTLIRFEDIMTPQNYMSSKTGESSFGNSSNPTKALVINVLPHSFLANPPLLVILKHTRHMSKVVHPSPLLAFLSHCSLYGQCLNCLWTFTWKKTRKLGDFNLFQHIHFVSLIY